MYQSKKRAAFFAGPFFILSVICLVLPANADTFSFNTGPLRTRWHPLAVRSQRANSKLNQLTTLLLRLVRRR